MLRGKVPAMRVLLLLVVCPTLYATSYNVRDYGARGDGVTKDTAGIQKAIDAAAAAGGGTVVLPAGRYLSGTIRLKSYVTLHLDNGATLLASPDNADFDAFETLPFRSVSDNETTYFRYGHVTAENVRNIAITGQGVIDGNRTRRGGPKSVSVKLCQYVSIRGITIQNAPNYAISFWGTDFVDVDGVTILNGFADGIDPDASRYVRISNCYIDCFDDAICPKASPSMGMQNKRPTEHLTVTNCILRTNCSNFKFGTESSGDLKDVTLSNCTMLPRDKGRRPISGIALESVDGAHIDGVTISNVTMNGVQAPLFLRLGNRGRGLDPPVPGSARNIVLSNIIARGASVTSSITGIPGHRVERVTLANVLLSAAGGLRDTPGLDVPEHEARYPEATMFGTLPAYGLYVRHADGISIHNVELRWEQEDHRPALILDDARNVTLDGVRITTAAGPAPLLWMNAVENVGVRGSRATGGASFLRVSGPSRGVALSGNDLRAVQRVLEPGSTAEQQGNLSPAP